MNRDELCNRMNSELGIRPTEDFGRKLGNDERNFKELVGSLGLVKHKTAKKEGSEFYA
jgi:hypothetical protein